MAFVVEMYALEPERRGFFCCSDTMWKTLYAVGCTHGWEPAGTAPSPRSAGDWAKLRRFENDYEPVDIQYDKAVSAEDASRWADALARARDALPTKAENSRGPTLLRDDMTPDEVKMANSSLDRTFLDRFIAFLRGGGFTFAWDD